MVPLKRKVFWLGDLLGRSRAGEGSRVQATGDPADYFPERQSSTEYQALILGLYHSDTEINLEKKLSGLSLRGWAKKGLLAS